MSTIDPGEGRQAAELDRLRCVLRAETNARGDDVVVDVGPAHLDAARSGPATGAFWVDTGERRVGDGPMVPLYLASSPGASLRHAVLDVIAWEGDRLLVEAELAVDELAALARRASHHLRLFAAFRPGLAARALLDRLDMTADLGLALPLLEAAAVGGTAGRPVPQNPGRAGRPAGPSDPAGRPPRPPDPAEQPPGPSDPPGRRPGPSDPAGRPPQPSDPSAPPSVPPQLGVMLGPPRATRPAMVRALQQLVAAERCVLLVSPDPLALDQLVLAADRALGGAPAGTLLRVGVPSTRLVGADPRLTANGAAIAQLPGRMQRLDQLTSALRALLAPPPGAEHRAPSDAGQPARPHIDGPRPQQPEPSAPAPAASPAPANGCIPATTAELEQARCTLGRVTRALAEAEARARVASDRHAAARRRLHQLDEARAVHRQVDDLVHRLEQAADDLAASAAGVGRLAAAEERRRRLLVAAEVATARLDDRDLAMAQLRRAQARAARLAHARADVMAAERAASAARAEHAAAERAVLAARGDQARAASRLDELAGSGPARRALAAAPSASGAGGGRVTINARRPATAAASGPGVERFLARQAADPALAARVAALREDYRRVRREVAGWRRDAARSTRIVAVTPDDLVSEPAVYERRYDNVLVDQAGRVPAAFVLWAAALSRRALTLVASTEEQPPPPALSADALSPELRRWLTASLLELIGLRGVDAVRRHPSGIVLD